MCLSAMVVSTRLIWSGTQEEKEAGRSTLHTANSRQRPFTGFARAKLRPRLQGEPKKNHVEELKDYIYLYLVHAIAHPIIFYVEILYC